MIASPTVEETLQRFRAALKQHFGERLREVTLFGSWARGEAHEESDVDVFVAIDDLDPAERHHVYRIAYDADADTGNDWLVLLSPLVHSTADAARMRTGGRRLFRDIDRRRDAAVTRDQQALAIEIETRRGRDALRSAEILLASSIFADAVSRAYYGALHFARALLLTTGEEPRTHAGVLRLISRDFVRTEKLAPELAHILSGLEKQRSDADYTSEMVFTEAAASQDVDQARRFVDAVAALLATEGWPSV